jgi:hypothetical protein
VWLGYLTAPATCGATRRPLGTLSTMPDDQQPSSPAGIIGVRSTSDLALDLATVRARILALRLAQALAQRLDEVVPCPSPSPPRGAGWWCAMAKAMERGLGGCPGLRRT